MSKNRVIVLSVAHQKLTVREVSAKYGVSERWIYMLLAKYRKGGILPLSRPQKGQNQTPNKLDQSWSS